MKIDIDDDLIKLYLDNGEDKEDIRNIINNLLMLYHNENSEINMLFLQFTLKKLMED